MNILWFSLPGGAPRHTRKAFRADLLRQAAGRLLLSVLCGFHLAVSPAIAQDADADVLSVEAREDGSGTWSFRVTVAHPDTGWEDYCNGWNVETEDGEILKRNPSDPFTRLLLHPHEHEQPFTRSQGGIKVPTGARRLIVRAHDIVNGFGGREVILDLGTESGPGYTIHR